MMTYVQWQRMSMQVSFIAVIVTLKSLQCLMALLLSYRTAVHWKLSSVTPYARSSSFIIY